jgi:rRNA maturation protein Nop10
MNLKYYLKGKKKIYTLKEEVGKKQTSDAHYKFIKIKSVKD